jgi:sulfoxide reductase heme-binding subunit YedZ
VSLAPSADAPARAWLRHGAVVVAAAAIFAVFWFSRLEWSAEMRLWRAIGDASLVLLLFALAAGPLARLWGAAEALISWRRETGIWFAILALVHTLLVFDGWFRWDLARMMGYEFIPQLGRVARIEPGFGLSNLVGLVAVVLALPLAVTSFDRAIDRLGGSAWRWLHSGAYAVFYLSVLHTAYFLFMHYTESFHRSVPPNPNWFRETFLVMALAIPALQIAAFARTVRRRRARRPA